MVLNECVNGVRVLQNLTSFAISVFSMPNQDDTALEFPLRQASNKKWEELCYVAGPWCMVAHV